MTDRPSREDLKDLAEQIAADVANSLASVFAIRPGGRWAPCNPASAFTQCGNYDCKKEETFQCESKSGFQCTGTFTSPKPKVLGTEEI